MAIDRWSGWSTDGTIRKRWNKLLDRAPRLEDYSRTLSFQVSELSGSAEMGGSLIETELPQGGTTTMLPKELLVDLEEGDRSKEFMESKPGISQRTNQDWNAMPTSNIDFQSLQALLAGMQAQRNQGMPW